MSIWKTPINLEALAARSQDTMASYLEIKFTEVGDDYLVASMGVTDHVIQPLGIMHGGASCVLAETVGSTAANYCVDQSVSYCVGLAINTSHIRPAPKGSHLSAKATPFHLGRTTQVWHIEIKNQAEKIISINRLTMAVKSK